MTQILTISGQRGGIGKTLTAVNLASALALYEKKTLLIDCDPRAVATQWMNLSETKYNLASFFSGKSNFSSTVSPTDLSHLDMIPSDFDLFFSSLELSKLTENETILRTAIRFGLPEKYDYIIIDSPSSWGFLTIVAHTAANFLIFPMCPDTVSRQDFECLLKLLGYIKNTHETNIKMAGLLANFCNSIDDVTNSSWYEYFSDLRDLIFQTVIPRGGQLPLILTNVKDKAADAFLEYTMELLSIFETNQKSEQTP